MIEKIEGIVINERDYSESSKILNVLTKEHGIIGVISKGCRKMKSELRSVSEKLIYGSFNLYYKQDKLSTLISVDIINSFKLIRKDIIKISYATFLLELTEQVFRQNQNLDIYELLISSLTKIDEGLDPVVVTNILELKYLDYLGVTPVLDSCVGCGSTNSIVGLSVIKGGYICNRCRTTEKILSEKSIKMIRMFYYVELSKITKIDISEQVKKEINYFLDEYYEEYTGLYLKSKTFLNNLYQIC
ncbi:MAG: DNA repair protein RecO [Bacilli bacterium]|nr:DNA repair protein RecO [Bacilli bacterium]MDD4282605.1 DNA repair protein RecO [Bacilli bacterium]MDD4718525.1 DNA repair protein RecO [Bacilli bacterium]